MSATDEKHRGTDPCSAGICEGGQPPFEGQGRIMAPAVCITFRPPGAHGSRKRCRAKSRSRPQGAAINKSEIFPQAVADCLT